MLATLCIAFGIGSVLTNYVLAYTSPGKPIGYVSDFAHILSAQEVANLDNKIGNFARPAGVQMALVTVPSLGGDSIEHYAVSLFEEWGIGQKIKDNGVLILVAPHEHEVRIEVGYGLEPTITDAMSSVIISKDMIPAFKTGDYATGIEKGVASVMSLVEGDPEVTQSIKDEVAQAQNNQRSGQRNSSDTFGIIIFFVFIVGANLLSIMARTKSWWLGGVLGLIIGLVLVGSVTGVLICVVIGLVVDYFLSKLSDKFPPKGSNGSGGAGRNLALLWFLNGGGRGGSGGFGGGFGGFGGGRSGGGGASGSW